MHKSIILAQIPCGCMSLTKNLSVKVKNLFNLYKRPIYHTGQHVESHGVVHNCDYTIGADPALKTFYTALKNNEWWDNGAEPIWITAVNQVSCHSC